MARARYIKPETMTNEDLAELPHSARLLFIYMWMIADRRGRLEDRPKRIRAKCFPYDGLDCEPLLAGLAEYGFITRYEIEGEKYLQINQFEVHQKPHPREAESVIPNINGEMETPIEQKKTPKPDQKPKEDKKAKNQQCPVNKIVDLYHEILPELAEIRLEDGKLTGQRAKYVQQRWRTSTKYQKLEWWDRYFNFCRKLHWLFGDNDRGWQANFEFLVTLSKFNNILENWQQYLGVQQRQGLNVQNVSSRDLKEWGS